MLVSAAASAASKNVTYNVGGKTFTGYLSEPAADKGKHPAVIIAPEWWGVSAHEKAVADKLASMGYIAFVLDLYGAAKYEPDPVKANELMQAAQKDAAFLDKNFDKGLETVRKLPRVDTAKIAAIGYGFGGGLVLDQARLSKDLKLAVNYYGGLINKGRVPIKPIKSEILVLAGEHDQYVDPKQIAEFKDEMKSLKAKADVVILKDAYQSFANREADKSGTKYQMPFQYSAEADKTAWAEVTKSLKRVFAQ